MKISYKYCNGCKCITFHQNDACIECLPFEKLTEEQYIAIASEMAKLYIFATIASAHKHFN